MNDDEFCEKDGLTIRRLIDQLYLEINLEFPASIETMLQRDQQKDGPVKAEKPQAGKDT